MPRPQKRRRICSEPRYSVFAPVDGSPASEAVNRPGKEKNLDVTLSLDEYEVIRMVDYLGVTHEQCAAHMDISRTTVTEIYERARKKIADMLINGKQLNISGGSYAVCGGESGECKGKCPVMISQA